MSHPPHVQSINLAQTFLQQQSHSKTSAFQPREPLLQLQIEAHLPAVQQEAGCVKTMHEGFFFMVIDAVSLLCC